MGEVRSVKKGTWSASEDQILTDFIRLHGPGTWRTLPGRAGLRRCGKSCRLRWVNYLKPGIKRGNISEDEEDLIIRLHKLLGNRWSLIAGRLPGRTDNEIKNYWNFCLGKRVKCGKSKQPINSSKPIQKSDDDDEELNFKQKGTTNRESSSVIVQPKAVGYCHKAIIIDPDSVDNHNLSNADGDFQSSSSSSTLTLQDDHHLVLENVGGDLVLDNLEDLRLDLDFNDVLFEDMNFLFSPN